MFAAYSENLYFMDSSPFRIFSQEVLRRFRDCGELHLSDNLKRTRGSP